MLHDPVLPLALGYLAWSGLTALVILAGWMLAAVYMPSAGVLARWQAAFLITTGIVLTAVQGLGAVRALTRGQLAWVALALAGVAMAVALLRARRQGGQGSLAALARRDLGLPGAVAREAIAVREPLVLAAVAALVPVGLSIAIVVLLRSWGWDPVWYHTPITNLAIQERSLGFVETHDVRAAGQPRVVELLSVWNVLLPRDLALDDAAQLPFAALGALAVAAWARRLGVTRAQAAGLGACWILAPPVFLQLHSTHVDVAAGALMVTAWVALTGPEFGRGQRFTALAAMALYAGTKQSGLFHGLFLAPLFLARATLELRADRRRGMPLTAVAGEALLAAVVLFWLGGGLVYLRNTFVWGNPTWPYAARLPLVGVTLPGPIDPAREWTRPFFLTPGSIGQLVRSWWTPLPLIWPDVRGGGYGPLFRWLTLPCTAWVALASARPGRRREAAAIVGLFTLALAVPDAWWPRYALAAPAAALAALAFVRSRAGDAWPGRLLGAVAVALAIAGIAEGWPGYHVLGLLGPAARRTHAERATLRCIDWLWPENGARRRETELGEGDAIAYDDAVYFLGELWARDLRNRVVYLPHPADHGRRRPASLAEDAAWLGGLHAQRVVWAAVGRGSRAERALSASGAELLFAAPRSDARVWRLPRALPGAAKLEQ